MFTDLNIMNSEIQDCQHWFKLGWKEHWLDKDIQRGNCIYLGVFPNQKWRPQADENL